jgi:radical SAM protein with 4Fe4S-binding SPASM domain
VRFSLLNPYNGRGEVVSPLALGVEQISALRDYCHEVRLRGSQVFINLPPLLLDPSDIVPIRSPSCGWTKSYCGITHDGYVTICGVAGADKSLHVGNILEDSFADIWNDAPLFRKLRSLETSSLTGICARCAYRDICGGACRLFAYKSTGDFTASYGLCQAFYDKGAVDDEFLLPEDQVTTPSPRTVRLLPLISVERGRSR